MFRVIVYSLLLGLGLLGSQVLPSFSGTHFLMSVFLGFIMIRVGLEFNVDKKKWREYAVDYGVAMTAAAFPWIFCACYFVWMFALPWVDALIVARFAAPTSAGILFTMLAAAGLAGSWVFRKVRILAIFDDLDTILFLIPIQVLMIGFALPLAVNLFVTVGVLFLAYRYMHQFPLSTSEWAILLYSAMLCIIYPFEILLPAFCLGAMIRVKGHEQEVLDPWIKAAFMFFVGFSMTQITWDFSLITPVIIITILSNLGKCFPLFCYRDRPLRERLAVSIALFPRGEVGGGVLALSLSYHLESHAITIAALSLALNLLMTPLFIWAVQWCIKEKPAT